MNTDEQIVNRGLWVKLRQTITMIPFSKEAIATYYCACDSQTPKHVQASILATLAYFIIPSDLIPDFITGLGYTDDITVFWAVWKLVNGYVKHTHLQKAEIWLARSSKI